MKPKSDSVNILLGAALAGLAISPSAQAAITIVNESSDFSNSLTDPTPPTDLTASFADFAVDSQVNGSINTTGDSADYFSVSMIAGSAASIPYRFSGTATTPSSTAITLYFELLNSAGTFVANAGIPSYGDGESVQGVINFTVPADGIVVFALSHESAPGSVPNYSFGAVPETGTAMLGLAGLAAAALRRKREQG